MQITKPKGTNDIVPADIYKWQYIEQMIRKTAADFGYSEIRFPTYEHTELFVRGVGSTTDVVQKEMFTFTDRGGRSLTLRPEGTASVVRSYLENALYGPGLPVKCFYICRNFRGEQPQAGRYREFFQFGVEYVGSGGAAADGEVIALAAEVIARLGIQNVKLAINSIGCPACRPVFQSALRSYFADREQELCGTCHDRLEKNPMRILDCKSPVCKGVAENAPSCLDHLCDECRTHFEEVKATLSALNISYTVDPKIVRGLDYYTRTVFEFISDSLGAQSSVGAGGRYDGLIETLGGAHTPALGFACGMERLLLTMEAQGVLIPKPPGVSVFIAALGAAARMPAQTLVHALRQAGISAEQDTLGRSVKAQMKYADRIGARYSMVIGDNELEANMARLKDMSTGEEQPCALTAQAIAEIIDGI